MLRSDVVDLASASLGAELGPRRSELIRRTAEVMERLAARAILGGPTFGALAEICVPEIAERVGIATRELQRACESKGVGYYRALNIDLRVALDELCSNIHNDVFGRFADLARVVPGPQDTAQDEYRTTFAAVASAAIHKGRNDLEHYAESLRTKRGLSLREKFVGLLLVALGAFILGGVQWIYHLWEKVKAP